MNVPKDVPAGSADTNQDQSTKPPRWRAAVKKLALLAGTLVVLVCGLEVAVRLFTNTMPQVTERDPVVGQRYLRNFAGDVYDSEAGRPVALRFNGEGFRGPERPKEKPPGVRRVAVLGDSMIAALAVDEEQTLVCELERLLNETRPQEQWEVLNFGVNGSSPGQQLVLYRELVCQYQPDIVLTTFFVGNDLADNCRRLSHSPRIYFDLDKSGNLVLQPFLAKRAMVSRFLNRYSRFYVWQRTATNQARHRVQAQLSVLSPGDWVFCRAEPPDVAHAWKLSEELLEAFRDEVEGRGSRFAMVMIPSAEQVYEERFQSVKQSAGALAEDFDPDYPDQRLGDFCRRASIPFLSMTNAFRRAAPHASIAVSEEWLFCNAAGHFNVQGNALAAQTVQRFLTQHEPQALSQTPVGSSRR